MALPKIGIKLSLDGLKEINAKLSALQDRIKAAASSAKAVGRGFANASKVSVRALGTITKAATRISLAMARAGTRAGKAFAAGVSKGAGVAKRALQGVAGGVGAVTAGAFFTANDLQMQSRLAKQAGTNLKGFSELLSVAREYNVEDDELSGGLFTLAEKLRDSLDNEGLQQLFQKLGIATQNANGELRDSVSVFYDLLGATQKLNETERVAVLGELMGGDAEKMAELLDLTESQIKAKAKLNKDNGLTVNDRQVRLAQKFLSAWTRLKGIFASVVRDVSLRLYPIFIRFFSRLGQLIQKNRKQIADFIVNGVSRLLQLGLDLVNMFLGNDKSVKNGWLYEAKGVLLSVWETAKQVAKTFAGLGTTIGKAFKEGLKYVRDFAFGITLAFGGVDTALKSFGRKATKEDAKRLRNIKLIDRQAKGRRVRGRIKEGGYFTNFTADEGTVAQAQGIAGGFQKLLGFFKQMGQAIAGDRNARAAVLDTLNRQIQEVISAIFDANPVIANFYYSLFGNKEQRQIARNSLVDSLLAQLKLLRDKIDETVSRTSAIGGMWYILTGRSGEFSDGENWVVDWFNDIVEVIDFVIPQLVKVREAIKELTGIDNNVVASLLGIAGGRAALGVGAAALGGQKGLGILGKAGALGGIVYATMEGVKALDLIIARNEEFRAKLKTLKAYIETVIPNAWQAFKDAMPEFSTTVDGWIVELKKMVPFIDKLSGFFARGGFSGDLDLSKANESLEGKTNAERAEIRRQQALRELLLNGGDVPNQTKVDWGSMVPTSPISGLDTVQAKERVDPPLQSAITFNLESGGSVVATGYANDISRLSKELREANSLMVGRRS